MLKHCLIIDEADRYMSYECNFIAINVRNFIIKWQVPGLPVIIKGTQIPVTQEGNSRY